MYTELLDTEQTRREKPPEFWIDVGLNWKVKMAD